MMKAFSDDPPTCHVLQCLNLSNVMQYIKELQRMIFLKL